MCNIVSQIVSNANEKNFLNMYNKTVCFFSQFNNTQVFIIVQMETDSEVSPIQKKKGGRPLSSIWDDINKGESVGSGKYSASCKYCISTWKRGDISKLEEHLANHCQEAPATTVRKYMTKVLERQDRPSKKRKLPNGQQSIDDYHDPTELPSARITRINRALIKFFVACGISFRIVEHPFFINFVRELNGGYNPPTREILAGQMLERELAQVNSKIDAELNKEENLTLGLFNCMCYCYLFYINSSCFLFISSSL